MLFRRFILIFFLPFSSVFAQEDLLVYDETTRCTQHLSLKYSVLNIKHQKSSSHQSQWFTSSNFPYDSSFSKFTYMSKASYFISSIQFPASATVKLVTINGDTTKDRCSGMMVGNKYVLTAAHCILKESGNWMEEKYFIPNFYVKPGFDNGKESEIGTVKVKKAIIFNSYFIGRSKKDVALLELMDTIGTKTGWVGLNYDYENELALTRDYLNFSYPMDARLIDIDKNFNGDTLYLKKGNPDRVSENYIGINEKGIPGESGSLLISHSSSGYSAYGVRNFSEEKYSFYRLKQEDVLLFSHIISKSNINENTAYASVKKIPFRHLSVYPNPMYENAILNINASINQVQLTYIDDSGKEVYNTTVNGNNGEFILENTNLPRGQYMLMAKSRNNFIGTVKLDIRK